MNNDRKFEFLILFGDIKEQYINEALKPWNMEMETAKMDKTNSDEKDTSTFYKPVRWYMRYRVAGVLLAFMFGLCLIFHTQVQAAMGKAIALISDILNLEDDVSNYTDMIGTTQEVDGIKVTLREVVLADQSLFAAVELDNSNGEENMSIAGGNVMIDGMEKNNISSSVTVSEKSVNQFVVEWDFEHELSVENRQTVDLGMTVYENNSERETEFHFVFETSASELSADTNIYPIDEEITIDEGVRVKVNSLSVNPLFSRICVNGSALQLDKYDYYFRGTDNEGNELLYSLLQINGGESTFQNESALPSGKSSWIELQMYVIPVNSDTSEMIDSDIAEEYSDVWIVDESAMNPVGRSFRVKIR